jgi:hypothetical protein
MHNQMGKTLYRAAALTFEDLGFMLPALELDEEQANASEDASVTIAFHGPFCGRLEIRICGRILPVFAANMAGEDGEPSREEQLDVLREIANVICGNLLPEIGGTRAVFNIDAPQVHDCGPMSSPQPELLAAEARIGIEQGRAELHLFLVAKAADER